METMHCYAEYRTRTLKNWNIKNSFSRKYVNQTLQKCKLDLLFDILKLFSKFHIIPQTHKEKKCGKLKWDRQTDGQTDGRMDRRTDGLTDAEESYSPLR